MFSESHGYQSQNKPTTNTKLKIIKYRQPMETRTMIKSPKSGKRGKALKESNMPKKSKMINQQTVKME